MLIYEIQHLIEIVLPTYIAKPFIAKIYLISEKPKTWLVIQNNVQVYWTFSEMGNYNFSKMVYLNLKYFIDRVDDRDSLQPEII